MRDDQLFGAIASVALLIWLAGRWFLPDPRARRRAEALALGIVAAAILLAIVRTVLWYAD